MKDPKAIRKAIMTAKSIASLIDPKFARVPLPDIGMPAPDMVMPEHSPSVHEAYDVPMPQHYAAGGDVDDGRELNKFGLYSHAAEQAAALPQERGTPEQYRGMLLNRGVKPAEMEWSRFDDAFANKPQITRDELAEHFRTNMPDLYETYLRGEEPEEMEKLRSRQAEEQRANVLEHGLAQLHGRPHEGETPEEMRHRHDRERRALNKAPYHEDYTIPGGENYREILLHHNDKNAFPGVMGHFGGAPDILTSLRMKDREDHEGDRVLHLEELQSDWAQKGRKKGFFDKPSEEASNKFDDFVSSLGERTGMDVQSLWPHVAMEAAEKLGERDLFHKLADEKEKERRINREQVKAAPYVTKTDDWVDLGLKRALLEAANGDYNKLSWTPGDKQADRYDLSKHISDINYIREGDGDKGHLLAHGHHQANLINDPVSVEELPNFIGKEAAEKLLSTSPIEVNGKRVYGLGGIDLKVGGEGMRKFYDEMLPKRLLKLARQHDPEAQLTYSVIEHPSYHEYANGDREEGSDAYSGPTTLPALHITPRMRESILKKGFAAYAEGGEVEGYAIGGVPDIDVERYRQHLKRIYSPLSKDPEAVKKALQISSSYRSPVGMETGTGSLYNIKQSIPAIDVNPTIEDIPGISMKKPVKKSWEDFYEKGKGGVFINMGGDLSNFGRLTHINGKKLAWPVDLHAGTKFMLEPNPKYVWGNAAGHSTAFENKIRSAEEAGKDVYGVFSPMGPSAVNSSHNMFDALMAQIPNAGIDKKHMREFDAAIKRGDHLDASIKSNPKKLKAHLDALKKWPGLENAKEASEFARPEAGNLTGTHRTMLVKFMDKADWLKKGFPEVGVTRSAITDPELKGVGGNKIGHRVVKLSSETLPGAERAFEHSTYPTYTSGEYVMDVPLVQRHYAAPDVIEQMLMKPTKAGQVVHPYSEDPLGRATARKLFEEQKQMQPINPRFLDSVMMGMENQEKYGFKKGGSVRRALMIAKSAKKK